MNESLPVKRRVGPFFRNPNFERKKISDEIKNLRTRQRNKTLEGNELGQYHHAQGSLLYPTIEELKKRALKQDAVNFLDAGAGYGQSLESARSISEKIKAHGLGPLKPPEEDSKNWIVGLFENRLVPNHFDIIQSRHGLEHSANLGVGLENMLNSLKEGGVLIMTPDDMHGKRGRFSENDLAEIERIKQTTKLIETLKKQGFLVEQLQIDGKSNGEYKITRGVKQADLKRFYFNRFLNRYGLSSKAYIAQVRQRLEPGAYPKFKKR